ncbi:Hmp Flavodoxin reductases (ferredoxin-NADPH reductases) family 1 [Rhabdaerophilaceae bacterium]
MAGRATWIDGEVLAAKRLSPTVRELTIMPSDARAFAFQAGAHVKIQVFVKGQPQTRSYSLVGVPDGKALRIAVKMRPETSGGAPYVWSLEAGARMRLTLPKVGFAVDFERLRYILAAGGIGVTPMVGLASALARRGAEVRMVYAVRDESELVYVEALRSALGDRLSIFRSDLHQRIDFHALFSAECRLGSGTLGAVCGPLAMLEDARSAWASAGLPAADLRWETFGSSGRIAAEDFRVVVARHNVDTIVPRNRTLIDVLAEAGVEVMSDCRRGECGLCALPIMAVDGVVDHRDVFFGEHEKRENHKICVCVSRASGTLVLDTDFRRDGEPHGKLDPGQFGRSA